MRLLIALAVGATLAGAQQTPFSRRAPGFSLPDSQLKQHDLADYKGKVVLIDFMKTDCPSCQSVTGTLERLKAKYKDAIVTLSVVLPPDNQRTVAEYVQQFKVTGPVLFDCGQMTSSYLNLGPRNPTVHFPRLIIVDDNGYIRRDIDADTNQSEVTLDALTKVIDGLLRRRTASVVSPIPLANARGSETRILRRDRKGAVIIP